MNTPICDFVKKYADEKNMRLHMPGHKGKSVLGVEELDITEIEGADLLYSSKGIIEESQKNASLLFDSAKTLYSTEGSSLCIRAMMQLVCLYSKSVGKKAAVLAARNAHKTFMSAAALLDLDIEWIYPKSSESMLSCKISAEDVGGAIDRCDQKPTAVYLTSPDYLGNLADIKGISKACHERGVLLLVDNAHGAYLNFLSTSKHPIALGADICCDSAHKTLPVLTGGAYLHISKNAPHIFCEMAECSMSLFASTSPSYLIMQSLDRANLYISDNYREKLLSFSDTVGKLKKKLADKGSCLVGDEILKLTVAPRSYGYTGYELADYLFDKKIVCEFSDPDFTVMMLTPEISGEDISSLEKALTDLERREPMISAPPAVSMPEKVMSVREAMLSPSKEVRVEDACGKILASPSVSCPPAVPILICGERIDSSAIRAFEYYGIEKCRVIE